VIAAVSLTATGRLSVMPMWMVPVAVTPLASVTDQTHVVNDRALPVWCRTFGS